MTDIVVVGLLLVIIFILISVFAPEVLIWGGVAFNVIFLVVMAVIAAMNFIADPTGSLLWALDHNPLLGMMDSMQQVTIVNTQFISGNTVVAQHVDIEARRLASGLMYATFSGVGIWFFIKLFFPMLGISRREVSP